MTLRSRAPGRLREGRSDSGGEAPRPLLQDATVHGGRLAAAMSAYPKAQKPWLDLSTGINPEPWAGPRAPLELLSRLPDPARLAELEAAAAAAFGVADPSRVVATAGAEAGLRLLPRVIHTDDIDIVSPTYSGHEAAWRASPGAVYRVEAAKLPLSTADVAVLVNPNNPDGRTVSRGDLAAIIDARTDKRRWTVVDESFVETCPELSVADLILDRLIVLRSFGKFYGLAGLRLGFVVAPPEVAARLRAIQGEWPVSAEAIWMGTKAYGDAAWRLRTQAELERRAADLDALFTTHGLQVVGGTSLFRLVQVADATTTFDALCAAGVLTRPFARREDWLRFGLPPREAFARLGVALRSLVR